MKRLRLLLAQAKGLLKEQGVPFMEEDAGLDVLLQTAGGKAGGRGGLPPRPGTSAHRASGGHDKKLGRRAGCLPGQCTCCSWYETLAVQATCHGLCAVQGQAPLSHISKRKPSRPYTVPVHP